MAGLPVAVLGIVAFVIIKTRKRTEEYIKNKPLYFIIFTIMGIVIALIISRIGHEVMIDKIYKNI